MDISFNWLYRRININSKRLKTEIKTIFQFYNFSAGELSFIFCDDDYLLDINRRYLKHDFYTDIITFDLSAPGKNMVGEIYISVERVIDNAGALKTTINEELHRVIFHGVLHLCGFKDKTKADKLSMRTAEDFWLANYFKN